jgi:hypothetical protein
MSGKLKNSQILLSSGGITPAKMNQSHWNVNWNWNSFLQSNKPSFSAIAAKMAKKSPENWKILLSSGGITPAKMNRSHWNVHWICNSLLQNNKPSFNLISAKIAKISPENWKILKFFEVQGAQLLQKWINHTETLTGTVTLQCSSSKDGKKSPENWNDHRWTMP